MVSRPAIKGAVVVKQTVKRSVRVKEPLKRLPRSWEGDLYSPVKELLPNPSQGSNTVKEGTGGYKG